MHQHPIMLGNGLPYLILLSDGSVAFAPQGPIATVYETHENGMVSIFDNEGFTLMDENQTNEYSYRLQYYYKELPMLKKYLVGLKLQNPFKEQE